jgi:hypothetical protein
MFRSRTQLLGWRLENGQHIEARVLVTLYEARGDFQLNVEAARRAGVGNLYEKFLRLKEKLEREGLFASAGKRPLPGFPRRIGIVTSLAGGCPARRPEHARARAPQVGIVVYPDPGAGRRRRVADRREHSHRRRAPGVRNADRLSEVVAAWRTCGRSTTRLVARAIRACPASGNQRHWPRNRLHDRRLRRRSARADAYRRRRAGGTRAARAARSACRQATGHASQRRTADSTSAANNSTG